MKGDWDWVCLPVGFICFILLIAITAGSSRNEMLRCEDEFPNSDCCKLNDPLFEVDERECCEKCEDYGMKYSKLDDVGWNEWDCYCWNGTEVVKLY